MHPGHVMARNIAKQQVLAGLQIQRHFARRAPLQIAEFVDALQLDTRKNLAAVLEP